MKPIIALVLAFIISSSTVVSAQAKAPFGPLPDGSWTLEEATDADGYTVAFGKETGLPAGIPEMEISGHDVKLITPAKTWLGHWDIRNDSLIIEPGEGMQPRAFQIVSIGPKEWKIKVKTKELVELLYRRKEVATKPGN